MPPPSHREVDAFEPVGIEYDRKWVALVALVGKYVDDAQFMSHATSLSGPRRRSDVPVHLSPLADRVE